MGHDNFHDTCRYSGALLFKEKKDRELKLFLKRKEVDMKRRSLMAVLSMLGSIVLLLMVSGCATPGLTKLDAGFLDKMRSGGKVTILAYKGEHSDYGGSGLGQIVGAAILSVTKSGAELHTKCIAEMEEVLAKDSSLHYVNRSSLGLTDPGPDAEASKSQLSNLVKQYGLNAFIRARLTFSVLPGLTKRIQLAVDWEVVSESNEIMLQALTVVKSEESKGLMPSTLDPQYAPDFVEMARKNAEQFVSYLKK